METCQEYLLIYHFIFQPIRTILSFFLISTYNSINASVSLSNNKLINSSSNDYRTSWCHSPINETENGRVSLQKVIGTKQART